MNTFQVTTLWNIYFLKSSYNSQSSSPALKGHYVDLGKKFYSEENGSSFLWLHKVAELNIFL